MKIMHKDMRHGEIKLKVENSDDLWYLSQIVDPGDKVEGKTLRKIKSTGGDLETQSSERRPVFISIEAEKIEFQRNSNALRIGGKITNGPDDVPRGSYHTFNVDADTVIAIIKQQWPKYQLDRLIEASEDKPQKIMICVLDREEAILAAMKKYGYEILAELSGSVEKKVNGQLQKASGDFYSDLIKAISEYDLRNNYNSIIIASPAFWKDELIKSIKDEKLKKKVYAATCSSVSRNAIDEVLKRDEVKQVLKLDRMAKETAAVEELLVEISKQALSVYGLKETENAIESGAARTLLLSDSFIQKIREDGAYRRIEKLMKQAEAMQGNVMIISSEHEAGRKLDGLGGIGAVLRYRMNY